MPPSPDYSVKERVRDATDIVDLIGSYVGITRRGNRFVALCPWHDDTNPSLQVDPERQSFRCWVCDLGGDVFSFVMKKEGVEFREALQLLADRAGIEVQQAKASPPGFDRPSLLKVMDWAVQQYHRVLMRGSDAESARAYLSERGFSPEVWQAYRLGYAPPAWDWLLRLGTREGISPAVLERLGLVIARKEKAGHYDRFRQRVLFPIFNPQARSIALGGRILPGAGDDAGAKYINSPETPLFAKSEQLYGLNIAKDAVDPDFGICVMEGYTDCIMAHQHGIRSAVAVLGTALGEGHLRKLRPFTQRVTLVLDGDEAGQRRTREVLGLFLQHEADLRILSLPEGLDPCDYIVSEGADAFRALLATAVDALEHCIRVATKSLTSESNVQDINRAVEEILATMALAPQSDATSPIALREEQVLLQLARRFQLPVDTLRSRMAGLRQNARRSVRPLVAEIGEREATGEAIFLTVEEQELCELALTDNSHHDVLAELSPLLVASPCARLIFEFAVQAWSSGEAPKTSDLLLQFDGAAEKNVALAVIEAAQRKSGSDRHQRLADLKQLVLNRQRDADVRAHMAELQSGSIKEEDETELLGSVIKSLRSRQAGNSPTEG